MVLTVPLPSMPGVLSEVRPTELAVSLPSTLGAPNFAERPIAISL
jgi:hypothetical protein